MASWSSGEPWAVTERPPVLPPPRAVPSVRPYPLSPSIPRGISTPAPVSPPPMCVSYPQARSPPHRSPPPLRPQTRWRPCLHRDHRRLPGTHGPLGSGPPQQGQLQSWEVRLVAAMAMPASGRPGSCSASSQTPSGAASSHVSSYSRSSPGGDAHPTPNFMFILTIDASLKASHALP